MQFDASLHGLVDARGESSPAAPAVICGEEILTYRQLLTRSGSLAAILRREGVRRGTPVGLCLRRSSRMIVCAIAILKAGGIIVPLDPAAPEERIRLLIDDAEVKHIVTEAAVEVVVEKSRTNRVLIDVLDLDEPFEQLSTELFHASDAAYIIFTSGSTGRPKGVVVEHRNICWLMNWAQEKFNAGQLSMMLFATSLSFDVAIFEIFAPLVLGGCIVVAETILDVIHSNVGEISALCACSSSLVELVRARSIPPTVTTVIQAGERFPLSLAKALCESSNISELWNMYGPTEGTIYATAYAVRDDLDEDPPIGQALPGTVVYLLDEDMVPVSGQEVGEIYLAGSGVTRGYINRPELNSSAFPIDLHDPAKRMYRTGDLAYRGTDYELRYVGRRDLQVKINGIRIELGEIEAVLLRHPALVQAAVVARDFGEHKVLAMYLVSRSGQEISLRDLQTYIGSVLPAYMVPSFVTFLQAMPLGATGKLDRKALVLPVRSRPAELGPPHAPENHAQLLVTLRMATLLGIDSVGIDDNFFALGGGSLLAMRLLHEIDATLGSQNERINEFIQAFVKNPTARMLASIVDLPSEHEFVDRRSLFGCVQEGELTNAPLFIFHGNIEGEAFYPGEIARSMGPAQPVYTFAPHGSSGGSIPASITEMASEFLHKIRTLQPHGPYHLIGYCNGGLVAFEIARMLEAEKCVVETLIVIATPPANIIRFGRVHRLMRRLRLAAEASRGERNFLFKKLRDTLLYLEENPEKVLGLGKLLRLLTSRTMNVPSNMVVDEYRNFCRAIDSYVPSLYRGKLTIVIGDNDQLISPEAFLVGWIQVAPQAALSVVAATHTLVEEHVRMVVQHLNESLRKS